MKALVLHAHPDDELIFAHALMQSRPHWEWDTVSLTGGKRQKQYRGLCLGFPDEWRILSLDEFRQWNGYVAALKLTPDIVFSHNKLGEYGHPHHMSVHRIAHEVFDDSIVWDFYTPAESSIAKQNERKVMSKVWVGTGKAEHFAEVYGGDVFAELVADHPDMMTEALGWEWFTGDSEIPE